MVIVYRYSVQPLRDYYLRCGGVSQHHIGFMSVSVQLHFFISLQSSEQTGFLKMWFSSSVNLWCLELV